MPAMTPAHVVLQVVVQAVGFILGFLILVFVNKLCDDYSEMKRKYKQRRGKS